MKRIYYTLAVMLALTWGLTFFVFHVGPRVHILILLAITVYLHAILTTTKKLYAGEISQGKLAEQSSATTQKAA